MNRKKIRFKAIIYAALAASVLMPGIAAAQLEKVEKSSLSEYEAEEMAKSGAASQVINEDGVDMSGAYAAGWDGIKKGLAFENKAVGELENVFGKGPFIKVKDQLKSLGQGIAIIQVGIDIYNGKTSEVVKKYAKDYAYSTLTKIFGAGMSTALIGVKFIDYSLTKFGETAIDVRKGGWNSAFTNYFKGEGRRNSGQWKEIFSKDSSNEAREREIRGYFDGFWQKGAEGLIYSTVKDPMGFGNKWLAEPLESEARAIENNFMKNVLRDQLQAVFSSLAAEAKKAKITSMQASYAEIVKELNAVHEVQVVVVGAKNMIAGLPVELGDEFLKGVTDSSGKYTFKFTAYGMILHDLKSPAKVKLTVKDEKGEKELSQAAGVKEKLTTVKFNVGGVSDIKGTVTSADDKSPVQGVKVGIAKEKKYDTTRGSGEYLLKDVPDGEYQVEAAKKGYEKAAKPVSLKAQDPAGGKNPEVILDIQIKPVAPSVKITYPKNGQIVENLRPAIRASVSASEDLGQDAINMKFDGSPVDFSYDPKTGEISYTPAEELKEDPTTKGKHEVVVTAAIPKKEGAPTVLTASCAFTAGIRPQVTALDLWEAYFKEPDKTHPLFNGQVYDKHSGPDPGSLLALIDGSPVKATYTVLDENWGNFVYFPETKTPFRGGNHTITVTIKDKIGIVSNPRTITFNIPGPDLVVVTPVDVGKVLSGEAFAVAVKVRNNGNGPAKNVAGVLICNNRQFANVIQANGSYGTIDPGMEGFNAPLFNVKTAQNLGNPKNGEPVSCGFTLRVYQKESPTQFWQGSFSVPIYPGEMTGGTVYVKLIHGTYMSGEWPIHIANQTVCLNGACGNFTAISDGAGNAKFENIPPGDYVTFVPSWYTYGAKLGEYVRSVTVEAGQEARATLRGSCPYIYTWDGTGYVKDNDVYSVANAQISEGSPLAFNEAVAAKFGYTDYYRLEKKLVERDSFYPLMLEEVRNEISHTDMVSLWVVDHTRGTKVLCDTDGKIITYRSIFSPLRVNAGSAGQICSPGAKDGKGWSAYNNDSIDVVFEGLKETGDAKLVVCWKGFQDGAGKEENACNLSRPSLKVYVKSEAGWKEAGTVYPRQEWSNSVVDLSGSIRSPGEVILRIVASSCHRDKYHLVDFIGLGTGIAGQIKVVKLAPAAVVHSALGDVTGRISASDDSDVEMVPGEKMMISFPCPEKVPGSERSFIFVSEGYYNSISSGSVAVRLGRQ